MNLKFKTVQYSKKKKWKHGWNDQIGDFHCPPMCAFQITTVEWNVYLYVDGHKDPSMSEIHRNYISNQIIICCSDYEWLCLNGI